MNDDYKIGAIAMRCTASVLMTIVVTIGGCNAYYYHKTSEVLKEGVSGIDAKCAMSESYNTCVILGAGREK